MLKMRPDAVRLIEVEVRRDSHVATFDHDEFSDKGCRE